MHVTGILFSQIVPLRCACNWGIIIYRLNSKPKPCLLLANNEFLMFLFVSAILSGQHRFGPNDQLFCHSRSRHCFLGKYHSLRSRRWDSSCSTIPKYQWCPHIWICVSSWIYAHEVFCSGEYKCTLCIMIKATNADQICGKLYLLSQTRRIQAEK